MQMEVPRVPWWIPAGLAMSAVLGLTAWFLPERGAWLTSIIAIAIWVSLLITQLVPLLLDEVGPWIPASGRSSEHAEIRVPPGESDRWKHRNDHIKNWGESSLPNGDLTIRLQSISNRIDANEERATERHRAEVSELQRLETNSKSQAEEIAKLNRIIELLKDDIDAEQSWGKKLAVITFLGGIAISIPVGVVINLSTK